MIQELRPGGHAAKKSRYTDEQIAYTLKQAELGTPVALTGVPVAGCYPTLIFAGSCGCNGSNKRPTSPL
jgi:hypothetical protein